MSYRVLVHFVAAALLASNAGAADTLPIATVNVDRILRDYKPLNDKIDPLKAEAKELEATIQVRQAELENVGNQLRQVQPGSADHQKLQIQIVKMQTDLQRHIATSRNSLQTREATIYLAFFRQLDAEISKLAKSRGIKLVLRQYESSFDDGQSLQDVAKALNRGILYEEGLDITDEILEALKSAPAKPAGT
jgi:Skp family chaperone for outer membrane proteins